MHPSARRAIVLSAASFTVFGICLTLPGALLPIVAHVTSILIAGAGAGGIVIPWLMSAVADRANITTGMAFSP